MAHRNILRRMAVFLVLLSVVLTPGVRTADAVYEFYYALLDSNDSNYYFSYVNYYGELSLYYDSW